MSCTGGPPAESSSRWLYVGERQVLYYGVYVNASKRLPRRRTAEGEGTRIMTAVALDRLRHRDEN